MTPNAEEPRFAVVAMLPENLTHPELADFLSRECVSIEEITHALIDLENRAPGWRVLMICHIEDLPMLMEGP